jgi:hypothetical protein
MKFGIFPSYELLMAKIQLLELTVKPTGHAPHVTSFYG